jgi:hypothetical protein
MKQIFLDFLAKPPLERAQAGKPSSNKTLQLKRKNKK